MKKHLTIQNVVLCLVALWALLITLFLVDHMFKIAYLEKSNSELKMQVAHHQTWIEYWGKGVNGLPEELTLPKEVR
jgi:hypothetical protein